MVRVRPVAAALAVCGLAAGGCSVSDQQSFKRSVADTFAPAPPAAANDFACMWHNRLMHLPDPSKSGNPVPGLAGQAFLYDPNMKAADVTGDMTFTVHDATQRPPGQPPMRSEVWHFTKDTLKNMVSSDERYGRSLVIFLPWPDGWREVSRLYIQARYDQPGGKVLFAQPATVTLDVNAPAGPGAQATNVAFQSIPDPATLVRQARAATATPQQALPQQYPVATAGGFPPPQYYQPPVQQTAAPGYPPQTAGGYQQMPAYYPPPLPPFPQQPPPGYYQTQPQQPLPPPNFQPLPGNAGPQVPYMSPAGSPPGVFQPPPASPPPDRLVIPRS